MTGPPGGTTTPQDTVRLASNADEALRAALVRTRRRALGLALGSFVFAAAVAVGVVDSNVHFVSSDRADLVRLCTGASWLMFLGLAGSALGAFGRSHQWKQRWIAADVEVRYVWRVVPIIDVDGEGDETVKELVLRLTRSAPTPSRPVVLEANPDLPAEEQAVVEQVTVPPGRVADFAGKRVVVATTADHRRTILVLVPEGRTVRCEGPIGPFVQVEQGYARRNAALRLWDRLTAPAAEPEPHPPRYPPNGVRGWDDVPGRCG